MKLRLSEKTLAGALIEEMLGCLDAMSVGDYDRAIAILEARVRPLDLMRKIPKGISNLPLSSVVRQVIELAPAGTLVDSHELNFRMACGAIALALHQPEWRENPTNLLIAANHAQGLGLSLEHDIPAVQWTSAEGLAAAVAELVGDAQE